MGGENTSDAQVPFTSDSGEIYDPVADKWTLTQPFPADVPNVDHFGDGPSELLPTGQILVVDGVDTDSYLFNYNTPNSPTNAWPAAGVANRVSEAGAEEGTVLLPDGSVLMYDLRRSSDTAFYAERYFPSSNVWADVSPPAAAHIPTLGDYSHPPQDELGAPVLLPPSLAFPQGRVFWVGGNNNTAYYDPDQNAWTAGPQLPTGKSGSESQTAMLPNGEVLVYFSSALYEFNPNGANDSSAFVPLNDAPTSAPTAVVTPNGHVLLTNGSSHVYDYTPDDTVQSGTPAPLPIVSLIDAPDSSGVYELHGAYLTGSSEGATEGDEVEMSTNYPIVKLTLGNRVWYGKTFNWQPGVDVATNADGTTPSVQFTLPSSLPAATYSLQVVASGIASAPVSFTITQGPVHADTRWAYYNYSPGDVIADPDPLAPGSSTGVFGPADGSSGDCFATIGAAVIRAQALGVAVVVNGSDGGTGTGVFNEAVALNTATTVYFQRGPVAVNSISGTAVGAAIALNGVTLTEGDSTNTSFVGSITGSGGLAKIGSGTWALSGTNNYLGGTTVAGGTLAVSTDAALGAPSVGVTLAGGGLDATMTLTSARAVTLSSAGGTIGADAGATFTLSGVVSGSGPFTKSGTGTLQVAGSLTVPNTATTVVSAGTLLVTGSLAGFGQVNVAAGAFLKGPGTIAGPVMVAGTVEAGSTGPGTFLRTGNLTMASSSGVPGILTALLTANGYDQVQVGGSTTLAGAALNVALAPGYTPNPNDTFTLIHSVFPAPDNSPFGTFANLRDGAVVSAGGQYFTINYVNKKDVVLTAIAPSYVDSRWANMTSGTPVADADPVAPGNQPAVVGTNAFGTVGGAIATAASGGVLVVNGFDSITGGTGNFSGEAVNVNKPLTLFLQDGPVQVGSLAGSVSTATIALRGVSLTVVPATNTSTEFDGSITGVGGLTKAGSGTFTFGGASTYTGATTVSAGTLIVTGSLGGGGTVTVASGAKLQGTGAIIAPVVVNGTLEAGTANDTGILTITGNLTLSGTLVVRINGAVAGPTVNGVGGYDQVLVNGNVTIATNPGSAAPTLSVVLGNYTPPGGSKFDVINLGSGFAETGTFGSAIVNFSSSYTGGDTNNDVVLTWIFYGGGN